MFTHIHTPARAHKHVCTHIRIHTHTHTHTHIYKHAHTHIYIYIYINTQDESIVNMWFETTPPIHAYDGDIAINSTIVYQLQGKRAHLSTQTRHNPFSSLVTEFQTVFLFQ